MASCTARPASQRRAFSSKPLHPWRLPQCGIQFRALSLRRSGSLLPAYSGGKPPGSGSPATGPSPSIIGLRRYTSRAYALVVPCCRRLLSPCNSLHETPVRPCVVHAFLSSPHGGPAIASARLDTHDLCWNRNCLTCESDACHGRVRPRNGFFM